MNQSGLPRRSSDTSASREAHADLDALAGTWSEQDEQDFIQAIAPLEQVDGLRLIRRWEEALP